MLQLRSEASEANGAANGAGVRTATDSPKPIAGAGAAVAGNGNGGVGSNGSAVTIVTKGEYARMRNRTPGAVSHWIRQGKLHGPALVGRGRTARIVVEEADRQLADLLDLGQQYAQERPITLALAPHAQERPDDDDGEDAQTAGAGSHQAAYYEARARKQQAEAALAEAKLQAQEGRWLDREAHEAASARVLAELMQMIDELPSRVGEPVAAELGVEARALVLALRRETRRVRAEWAKRFEERARARREALARGAAASPAGESEEE